MEELWSSSVVLMEDGNLESAAELSHSWCLFNSTLSLILSALQTSLPTIGFWNSQIFFFMFTTWKPTAVMLSKSREYIGELNWYHQISFPWLCISSPPTSFRALPGCLHQALWGQWLGGDTKEIRFLCLKSWLLVFSYGVVEGPEFDGYLEEGCFFS